MDRTAAAAAASRLGLPLSAPARVPRGYYYATAADHFALAASHFAAAARYFSTALRARRRASAPGEASSSGGDLDSELGLPFAPSASSSAPSAASSSPSPSILPASGSASDAGTDGGRDNEDDDIAERVYELLYVVVAGIPPYPLYKLLPDDVVCGAAPAWTWFLIVYGVAFAAIVTVVSDRVFRSPCCASTCLLALLFVASVAVEVAAGMNIAPPTRLVRGGIAVTVVSLVALYILAWTSWGRSRLD